MKTTYFRDHDGWNAKTVVEIEGGRQLAIRTSRNCRGSLASDATVWSPGPGGTLSHVMSFGLAGGDFSKRLALTQPSRVTERVVREQHEAVLVRIELIRADAAAFYRAQQRCDEEAARHHEGEGHALGA